LLILSEKTYRYIDILLSLLEYIDENMTHFE